MYRSDCHVTVMLPISGMEKKNNVMSPAKRKVVAFHEAGHALTRWLLEHTDPSYHESK